MGLFVGGIQGRRQLGPFYPPPQRRRSVDGLNFRGVSSSVKSISNDPRVGGYRHDQTAAGIVAHQLGLPAYADNLRDVQVGQVGRCLGNDRFAKGEKQ